jgi:hypothetical protein
MNRAETTEDVLDPVGELTMQPSSICPTWVFFAGTTAPCRPNGARQQLATAKVTRTQYEDWRKAKNRALRSFLKDKTRDSELVTITAPGFVHGSPMDPRLLRSDASPEDRANHWTGVEITTKFLDWKLRTGDKKVWSKFVLSPGTGVVVERLSGSIAK